MISDMDPSYPIGAFEPPKSVDAGERREYLRQIASAPGRFREAVQEMDDAQLDTPYRPGGWTVRQVVHHVADSHMQAYMRTRVTLTEEYPPGQPRPEALWAELADAKAMPVELSLGILDGLHARWVFLFRSLAPGQFARTMFHPEHGALTLDGLLKSYSWHGPHHVAHVTGLRGRSGF